jgi:hypothetical protein
MNAAGLDRLPIARRKTKVPESFFDTGELGTPVAVPSDVAVRPKTLSSLSKLSRQERDEVTFNKLGEKTTWKA